MNKCRFRQCRQELRAEKFNRMGVQPDASLDAPAAGLLHAAPVLETFRDQAPGRYCGDRIVPVLNLDRMQCDIDDIAIRANLRHLNPVSDAKHVVRGELEAGYK